jgi:hypothetical protein
MQRVQARVASDELSAHFDEPPPRLESPGAGTPAGFPAAAAGGV